MYCSAEDMALSLMWSGEWFKKKKKGSQLHPLLTSITPERREVRKVDQSHPALHVLHQSINSKFRHHARHRAKLHLRLADSVYTSMDLVCFLKYLLVCGDMAMYYVMVGLVILLLFLDDTRHLVALGIPPFLLLGNRQQCIKLRRTLAH